MYIKIILSLKVILGLCMCVHFKGDIWKDNVFFLYGWEYK
jgi:hypothetical protein